MATKNHFREFWKDTPFKGLLSFSILLNFVSAGFTLAVINFLPPLVPVLYGQPTGENQLLPTLGLLIIPIASVFITLINIFMGHIFNDKFSFKILIATSSLVSVLSTITVIKIIFLVGFF